VLFGVLCLACVVATTAYVALRTGGQRAAEPNEETASADALQTLLGAPHLLFVDGTTGHPRVGVAALAGPAATRTVTSVSCDRVYFAGGRGICSGADERYYGNRGVVDLDASLQTGHRYEDPVGISSRARVSSDGHYGSVTVFVAGDSYGAPFSTRDALFDLTSGASLGTLEDYTVYKDGAAFQSPNFNFWGTTFAHDGDRFYATLGEGSVGATTYLVEGSIATRQLRVLRTNVECPSLSPDGARIAYKKRISEPATWQLAVLDLTTLRDTMLDEARSVDDQVEWLDDTHILYATSRSSTGTDTAVDIWLASTTNDESPRLYLTDASSPVVVH
jgi:hypothetical protein